MKLTKIKLVNWHLFRNETINVNGNFLITGENGCGKSTLMDAVYYVLSGGDESCFNNAANAEAKRSVTTYVRGRVGNEGEGKEFLRNDNDIISHLALEFNDGVTGKNNVLGCVIEIVDFGKPRVKFYTVQNHSITDDDILDGNNIRDFKALEVCFKEKGYDWAKLEDSIYRRKKMISSDVLKLESGDRYSELLRKAMAFRPIYEVSSFVNDFLLKENNIEITTLMDEIRQYREINNELLKEEEKAKLLETFVPKGEKYQNNINSISYYRALNEMVEIKKAERDVAKFDAEISKIDDKINNSDADIQATEDKLRFLQNQKKELEADDTYNSLKDKKERLEFLIREETKAHDVISNINLFIERENQIISQYGMKFNFQADIERGNYALYKDHLRAYQTEIERYKENNNQVIAQKMNALEEKRREINAKKTELATLDRGQNTYSPQVIRLLSAVRNGLRDKYGKDIEVKPLCEYLDINDVRWTNAIEGYLNTQRFDLVVDPLYFDDAAAIYEDIKAEQKIYGIGIIHSKNEVPEAEAGTLYSKIDVTNPYAAYAAWMILGRVHCAEDIRDLKNYDLAITKTCMVYRNRTVRNINPEVYKFPYLGNDSFSARREILADQIAYLNSFKEEMEEQIDNIRRSNQFLGTTHVAKLLEYDNVWERAGRIAKDILDLEDDIKLTEKENDLFALQDEIKSVTKQIQDVNVLLRNKKEENKKLVMEKGSKATHRDYSLQSKDNHEVSFKTITKTFDEVDFEEFTKRYQNKNGYDVDAILNDFKKASSFNNNVRIEVEKGMREYVNKYSLGLSPTIENINDFIIEFYKIKNRNLVDYKEKAEVAFQRCKEGFEADFISKLHGRIDEAKEVIKNINKTLKAHPFGYEDEIYEFTFGASEDDEMKEYYKIITSGKDMEAKDLFTEVLSEKELAVMRKLFDRIVEEMDGSASEKKLDKYLDYRNYMKYDIKITDRNDNVQFFSKTNRGVSGGEGQTPFYVVVAACFDQLMSRSNGVSACPVMFDEAFNNMDESRINALMSFYKDLNIQLSIVVPSNRMATLAPFMDEVVGLIKVNNTIHIGYLG